jgi:DNA-binding NarL/FixJ family response regulator
MTTTMTSLARAQAAVLKATALRDELVLRAAQEGISARQIAQQLGVTHPTVRAIIQRAEEGRQATA